jgi:hypothetical protein
MLPKTAIQELEALYRRFFWGKQQQGRYIAYVAWDKMYSAIEVGGLGFQRLTELNEAMLLKAFWVLVTKPDITWVAVCTGKYLERECTWWTVDTSPPQNTIISQILQTREMVLSKFTWNLTSGESVRAVGEPWFSSWRQSAQLTGSSNLMVADLWNASTKCTNVWPHTLLGTYGKLEISIFFSIYCQTQSP